MRGPREDWAGAGSILSFSVGPLEREVPGVLGRKALASPTGTGVPFSGIVEAADGGSRGLSAGALKEFEAILGG